MSKVVVMDEPAGKVAVSAGLVSIVVPCFGQLEHTRICVPRILRHSRAPFEVIFVDGGGLDGTSEYVAGVCAIPTVRAEVVPVDGEAGLLGACAAGVEAARGEFVVFVSNDTLVCERWLNHLVAAAKVAADVGMVGVMSNICPPPQWVGRLPYRIGTKKERLGISDFGLRISEPLDLEPVEAFTKQWREENAGKSFEVERLGGSCLLLKTEVCKKISWDEASTPFGAIDGDLLSEKVRKAGYRLVCCRDLFLHHFGSRLFAALRV